MNNKLIGITLQNYSKKSILDKIKKYTIDKEEFVNIVSLNPENVVIANKDKVFKEIVTKSQIKIVDGIGIVIAAKILNLEIGPRLTGTDLMNELVRLSSVERLRVVLLGGKDDLAKELAICYSQSYPMAKFIGLKGIEDIKNIKKSEEERIFSIITAIKPHLLLVSFGSPYQEKWLWQNKAKLKGIVCMGVGGAFDFISGNIRRAPFFIRRLGFEWLYRLIRQPWRLKRQLKLITFIYLVLKQKFNLIRSK